MRGARGWMLVLGLVPPACSVEPTGPSECEVQADCDDGQHCLVDAQTGSGRCLDAPGYVEDVPVRVFFDLPRTDVLLLVDDGPGTAEIQARLVASLDALVQGAREHGNDLRVAVTTTSMSDALCVPPHEADRGAFRATSCLDRLGEFVTPEGTDARWLCTEHCAYTTEQLGLSGDRPWFALASVPEGIDPVEALACLVPQGISGCEHAAPLEAIELAFRRTDLEDEPELGFFRYEDTGRLVVVTDDVDCSLSDVGIDAFDPAGMRALWSDPEAPAATAAVCWNAGVECSGDPSGYDQCRAVDRSLDGTLAADAETPVLEPVDDYDRLVASELQLHVIAGFPLDGSEPAYSAAGDPAWVLEHGVDPGCTDGTITALPPVRMHALAAERASVCAPDYRAMLGGLPRGEPLCVRPCDAELLEVSYEPPDQPAVPIGACEQDDGVFVVPAGAPACFAIVPEAEGCADSVRSSSLVLRAADLQEIPAFLVSPSPWSESTAFACSG